MRDMSNEGPASPTSITGGLVGTSAGLLLVDTMVLGRGGLTLQNTLRPHGGRQLFLWDQVVLHKSRVLS